MTLGKHPEYESDLQRAKAVQERLDPAEMRLHRVRQRIQDRQLSLAVQEAEDVFLDEDLPAAECYALAGSYAKMAEAVQEPAHKEALAARAVQALRRAIAAGYTSPVPLGSNPDFRVLLAREEFKRLSAAPPR